MIVYEINEASELIISTDVIEKMNKYRQQKNMKEKGGILLGKVKADYSQFIITDISKPTRFDKSEQFSFVRSKVSAQRIINKKWKESDGEVMYLGEWHTHPSHVLIPSPVDRTSLNKNLYENIIVIDRLFMIILGTGGELFVGCQSKNIDGFRELKRINSIGSVEII